MLVPVILVIIVLGLLSRKIQNLPEATGDMLYALMMFFLLRFIFIQKKTTVIAALSLSVCFTIEFMQLYQAPWLNEIRATLPGRLILGQGFLCTDLIAYTLGVGLGVVLEKRSKFR